MPGDGEDDLRSLCSPLTSAVPLGDGGGGVGGAESEMGRMKKSPRGEEAGGSCTAHRMWAWRTRSLTADGGQSVGVWDRGRYIVRTSSYNYRGAVWAAVRELHGTGMIASGRGVREKLSRKTRRK